MNHPIKFLDRDNKTELVPYFFFLLFRILMREKQNLTCVIVINNGFNLAIIKKLIKLFNLHCSCKKIVEKS